MLVEADVANADGALLPGTYAEVDLSGSRANPWSSCGPRPRTDGAQVAVVQPDKFEVPWFGLRFLRCRSLGDEPGEMFDHRRVRGLSSVLRLHIIEKLLRTVDFSRVEKR